jgi:hypothetical protein
MLPSPPSSSFPSLPDPVKLDRDLIVDRSAFRAQFAFFFNERHEMVPISLIKWGLQPASRDGRKAKLGVYNCTPNDARQAAPAESQRESSCLTLQTRLWTGDSLRLKIRQFRSFQISQLIRSARQREALQLISCREVKVTHHSNGVEDVGQAVGCRSGSPIQMAISFHTRRVKRQSASK